LHDELAKRKTRMVMWTDMIYSSLDTKYWKASPQIADRLPKDILMNVWTHNDIGKDRWQDVPFFQDKGFETIYSPFLNKEGANNMIELCLKEGSKGILQTTWHKPQTAMDTVIFSGAKMWRPNQSYYH